MTVEATPPAVGRRTGLGTVVLMAAYLVVAPPLFLLAPLLVLLLLSGPRTRREWFWILLAALASYVVVGPAGPAGTVNGLLALAAIVAALSYAGLTRWAGAMSVSGRILTAIGITALAVVTWGAWQQVDLAAVDQSVRGELQRALDLMLEGAAPEQRQAASASADTLTRVFPAVTALQATVGLGLAARWHHLVAVAPIGEGPKAFREFRFNDHLVWGAIFTLAAAVLAPPEPWARLVTNGMVFWVGLYVARGLAVMTTMAGRWPPFTRLLALVASVLAFPFAAAGLVTVGLMDTWIDFRGRLASLTAGGQ